ncbi:MAG TPA: FtsX-like permease family protein [Candidatus Kryptonia bacterium]|nr:FtsX-like permease family protein [Candidatus Kryptonia bacterium]
MLSAPTRKSITDLSRRKSRTFFAVTTLALAVAGIGLFALPTLMNRSMDATVAADQLPDLTVSIRPVVLSSAQLAALAAVPNVTAIEPRSFFSGPVYVGARRAFAQVRGIADFGRQNANVVHVASGAAPVHGELLTDVQNAKHGLLDVHAGETVQIIGADGAVRRLRVSGEGRNLDGAQSVTSDNVIVLYANTATVASLSGVNGYEELDFRLADTGSAAVKQTTTTIRDRLAAVPGFNGFSDLPETRAAGDWPGKSSFLQFTKFFYVITVLALLSALVLIYNTITTLVAEQTSEIGIMKAVGGRRRQVAAVYLKTALLLGALGTGVGIVFGVVLANGLARYFGSTFFAVTTRLGVDWRIVLLSALVGLAASVLVALPAIRRAVRVPVREALQASGSAVGEHDANNRFLRGVRFLPRTAQIGLRNVGRRRRRSIATALVIAFAVGTLLAVLGLAQGAANASRASWGDHGEDVKITAQGHRRFDATAANLIRATPGVASIEPMFVTDVNLAGKDAKIWAVTQATMFHYRLAAGRWYTPAEQQTKARVAVVERDIARVTSTRLGDTIGVETASGPVSFRVIGISTNQQESGTALFVPLTTMHALLPGMSPEDNDYWVRTTSHAHALIDSTTTRIEDTLTAHGYPVNSEIKYVRLANEVASNRTITTTLAAVGFLVVAISMAGLASALTTSVLERTREIGILRSIGARARHIRRIFATETIALAAIGWLIAIPIGYLLERFLVWMLKQVANVDVPFTFPLRYLALALAGTIVLALLITLLPIRRAARYPPGHALRYA